MRLFEAIVEANYRAIAGGARNTKAWF